MPETPRSQDAMQPRPTDSPQLPPPLETSPLVSVTDEAMAFIGMASPAVKAAREDSAPDSPAPAGDTTSPPFALTPLISKLLQDSALSSKLKKCRNGETDQNVGKLIGPKVQELLHTEDLQGTLCEHFSERLHDEDFLEFSKLDESAGAKASRDVNMVAASNNAAGTGSASPSAAPVTDPAIEDPDVAHVVHSLKQNRDIVEGLNIPGNDLADVVSALSAIEAQLAELGDPADTDKLKKARAALIAQRSEAMKDAKDKKRTAALFIELQWSSISSILMILHGNLRSLTQEQLDELGRERSVEHLQLPNRLFAPPPAGTRVEEYVFAMVIPDGQPPEAAEPRLVSKVDNHKFVKRILKAYGENTSTIWLWVVDPHRRFLQVTLPEDITIAALRKAVGRVIGAKHLRLHILPGGDSHRFAFKRLAKAKTYFSKYPSSPEHPWYVWDEDEDINVSDFLMESAPRVVHKGKAAKATSDNATPTNASLEQLGSPQNSQPGSPRNSTGKRTSEGDQGSDRSRLKSGNGQSVKGDKKEGSTAKSPESVAIMDVVEVSAASLVEFALQGLNGSESLDPEHLDDFKRNATRQLAHLFLDDQYTIRNESDLDGWTFMLVKSMYPVTPGDKTFYKRTEQGWTPDGVLSTRYSGGRVFNTVFELKRGPGDSLHSDIKLVLKNRDHFMYLLLNQGNKYSLTLGARFIFVSCGESTRLIEQIHKVDSALALLLYPPIRASDCWDSLYEPSLRSVLAAVIYELDKSKGSRHPPSAFNMSVSLRSTDDEGDPSSASGSSPSPDAQDRQGGGGGNVGDGGGDDGVGGNVGGSSSNAGGSSGVRKADAWKTETVMHDSGVNVEDVASTDPETTMRQHLRQPLRGVLPTFEVGCLSDPKAMVQAARQQHPQSIWASQQIGDKFIAIGRRLGEGEMGEVFASVHCGWSAAVKVVAFKHAAKFFAENNNYEKLAKLQEGPIAKKLFAGIRDDGNLVMVVERGYVITKVPQSSGDDGSSDSDDSSSNHGDDDESSDDDQSISGVGGNIATAAAAGSEAEPAVGATDGRPSDLKLAIGALQQIHEHEAVHGDAHLGNVAFVGVEPHRRAFWFDLARTSFPPKSELVDKPKREIKGFKARWRKRFGVRLVGE
ncbi:hypothetical protein HK105_209221 [Polyrhizophydium stewartii]|uniref:Protein kinase domain-containing protein n=2 Tax=Polyrhizophydium stewartii TaxID=2732419 RepID=A0ABR4MVN6_9FUNG